MNRIGGIRRPPAASARTASLAVSLGFLGFTLCAASPGDDETVRWHTVELGNLGCRVSVPLRPPGYQESLRQQGDGRDPADWTSPISVRIQNYTEADLIPGQVPRLRPGQFFLEIEAASVPPTGEGNDSASHCLGPLSRYEPPAVGAWCAYNQEHQDGEGSITHLAWLWQDGIHYRLQVNGRQLAEGGPAEILSSFACDRRPPATERVEEADCGSPGDTYLVARAEDLLAPERGRVGVAFYGSAGIYRLPAVHPCLGRWVGLIQQSIDHGTLVQMSFDVASHEITGVIPATASDPSPPDEER